MEGSSRSVGTSTAEGFIAECEIRIEASPETVFDFFVDPQKIVQWMGEKAELDPRPGGVYHVDVLPGAAVARGEFVRVDRPRSLAFTFGWEGDEQPVAPGSSTVEVTLTPDGEGTVVRLVHSGLPSDRMRSEHTDGWTHYLSRLATRAGGGDPGRDPNLDRSWEERDV